ncbi:toprim domain-containing protein [Pararobbsia alpina]|nr:toprim domain-containing protein [Pararobbsia alpina]
MAHAEIEVNPAKIIADGEIQRIHVIGDKRGSRNAWYKLHFDEHPNGMFGCHKRYPGGQRFTWKSSERAKPMTDDERRALRERMQAKAREREEEDRKRHAAAAELAKRVFDGATDVVGSEHAYLARKGVESHGLKVGAWEKLNRKTGELSLIKKDALLVPIRDARGAIHSLQAIFPDSDNPLKRDKDYLTDGDKRGRFHLIGEPLTVYDKPVILICEGYATGASLYEATGHGVVVAFDAGNLMPVAQVVRNKFPTGTIIICADNDQWTLLPVKNPGVTRATEAANAIGGCIVFPPFTDDDGRDDNGKRKGPTDFNDLAKLRGPEAICAVINEALVSTIEERAEPDAPWAEFSTQKAIEQAQSAANVAMEARADDEVAGAGSEEPKESLERYFRVLGHGLDGVTIHVFSHSSLTVVKLNSSNINEGHLVSLTPNVGWWEEKFPNGRKKGIDTRAATAFLTGTAHRRGVYDPSNVRGRGAWLDAGRVVFHHGDTLSVDGVDTPVAKIASRYTYPRNMALPRPAKEALSDEDGIKLVNLAKKFRWSTSGSAVLLAGFVMLAPLCGALRWRPHIWLTGGAGCGKSTILNDYVHPLMNGNDLFAQGNSSEAGFRQTLRTDARPVLFDESESNEEGDIKRIQNVLSLIRQSSTESDARTLRGTAGGEAMSFHIRSMFCLASIQVAIKHQADVERLTVLALRSKRDDDNAAESWKALRDELYRIKRDPTIAARLMRRALALLPVIQANIDVFTEVAAQHFGTQREGDQYGTLLAGAWALVSQKVVAREEAEGLIDSYDWSEHRDGVDSGDSDAQKIISTLFGQEVVLDYGERATLYSLVRTAAGEADDGGVVPPDPVKKKANKALMHYGLRVVGQYIAVANSEIPPRNKLLAGTFLATDLKGALKRLPGQDNNDNEPIYFGAHKESKVTRIPLSLVIDDHVTDGTL